MSVQPCAALNIVSQTATPTHGALAHGNILRRSGPGPPCGAAIAAAEWQPEWQSASRDVATWREFMHACATANQIGAKPLASRCGAGGRDSPTSRSTYVITFESRSRRRRKFSAQSCPAAIVKAAFSSAGV